MDAAIRLNGILPLSGAYYSHDYGLLVSLYGLGIKMVLSQASQKHQCSYYTGNW